jgi:hypothetical protein
MGVLDVIGWCLLAATVTWGVTLHMANLAFARVRAHLEDELDYWQRETVRTRGLATQLKQEIATLSRGRQQGREDVMAIMPLLVAAQEEFQLARAANQANTKI